MWAHHMFTSGMSDFGNMIFALLTMIVAVPSAIKVFNWVATLYKGSIDFNRHCCLLFRSYFCFALVV